MIRQLGYIGVVLILFLASCTTRERIPNGIYDKDKMQAVLWDMLLADRFSAQYLLKDSARMNVKEETFKLYEQVFAVHQTSREAFVKSYRYYLNRPDLTKEIFDSLTSRATRSRDQLYKAIR